MGSHKEKKGPDGQIALHTTSTRAKFDAVLGDMKQEKVEGLKGLVQADFEVSPLT